MTFILTKQRQKQFDRPFKRLFISRNARAFNQKEKEKKPNPKYPPIFSCEPMKSDDYDEREREDK